ncbi:MAG: HTH-type transcriptional regulator CymR [Alphaproteobacteria bacterium ADurb.Bin438]|nr:MAG: HTH-type transcriptional regulator CymR [Alphaproteobacteria bacterium ADurb.Bin438]
MKSVLKMSDACKVGIHAVVYIARKKGEPVTSREIAANFKISYNHLLKVLANLVKADILCSLKGPQGGFVLKNYPENLNLYTVFKAIDGEISDCEVCLFDEKACMDKKCILGEYLCKANREFVEFFKSKYVIDLI